MSGFVFNDSNKKKLEELMAQYPEGRRSAASTGAMYLALQQEGCVSDEALAEISRILGVSYARLWELRSFYQDFSSVQRGRIHVVFCRGICCGMKSSEKLKEACLSYMGIACGETRFDGLFSASDRDCLGNCLNAPVMLVNGVCFERLTPERGVEILKKYESEEKC